MNLGFGGIGNSWIKTVGVYIILILAVLRLLIYPLYAAVKDKRAILDDQQQTYLLKSRLLMQARQTKKADVGQDMDKVRLALYPREARVSEIQAEMLTALSHNAAKQGLTLSGFEAPEAVADKKISEVTIVLRLSGGAGSFVELLKSIRDNKKTFAVKAMEISTSGQGMTFSLTISAFRLDV